MAMQLDPAQPLPSLPSHSPTLGTPVQPPQAAATSIGEPLPLVTITHSVTISAIHRLSSQSLTELEARARYGCAAMTLHGHEYEFKISFRGVVDRQTGQIQASSLLEDTISLAIVEVLNHKNLSDVGFFLTRPSTLENLALFAYRNVSIIMSPHPFDVVEVSVESEPCPRDASTPGTLGRGGRMGRTKVSFSGEMVNMST